MMNPLPAREVIEEGTKQLAEMCAGFWKELKAQDLPDDVAFEMSMIFTEAVCPLRTPSVEDD